jgi:large subunit ribosomal protein L6
MSRIGKKPVPVPAGVTANLEGSTLSVKGPKGTLSMSVMDDLVRTTVEDGQISVQPVNDSQRSRAAWGM